MVVNYQLLIIINTPFNFRAAKTVQSNNEFCRRHQVSCHRIAPRQHPQSRSLRTQNHPGRPGDVFGDGEGRRAPSRVPERDFGPYRVGVG